MYTQKIYRHINSNEYHYSYAGNYGARGEKRAPKKNTTPEAVKRYSQILRQRKMTRLIEDNFTEDDYWLTLKYRSGTRKSIEEVKLDIRKFFEGCRAAYKKTGNILKYIYRVEISKRGGIHFHVIMNRIPDMTKKINAIWKRRTGGNMEFEYIYDDSDYSALAAYIVKEPDEEEVKQLSLFDKDERKTFIKYSASRNLIRKDPEVKRYSQWTMRHIFANDLKPTPGFAIVKSSIERGVNAYTGMAYLYYREIRIDEGAIGMPVRLCECPYCHQFTLDEFRCTCRLKMRKRGRRCR